MSKMLLPECICGSNWSERETINNIPVLKCTRCGVRRQDVQMSKEDYFDWYASREYHTSDRESRGMISYDDRYLHDKNIASIRVNKYKALNVLNEKSKVLDIGTGNGAFVHYLRENGFSEAYGTEPSKDKLIKHVYNDDLLELNLPTQEYDLITLHDVLEHMVNPLDYLKEIHRIISNDGTLIVDFPNFWCNEGVHHWKPVEHLWMLNEHNIVYLLREYFDLQHIDTPIPSKTVYYFKKKVSEKPAKRILVLPGMGDIYWVLVKLQDFIKQHDLGIPEIWIWNFDERPRSADFVKRFPFVKFGGYFNAPVDRDLMKKSYENGWQHLFPYYEGFDYYIGFNGGLRDGKSLHEIEPQYKVNWDLPMMVSLEERHAFYEKPTQYGKYALAYFSELGMFRHWVQDNSPHKIYQILKRLSQDFSLDHILLTGSYWDKEFNEKIIDCQKQDAESKDFLINMIGETSIDSLYALMKASKFMIGWCGGNTILSAHFKVPTVIFWHYYFRNSEFWYYSIRDDVYNKTYKDFNVSQYSYGEIKDFLIKAMS